jgi:anaerobic C4-dicarboxylate transporter
MLDELDTKIKLDIIITITATFISINLIIYSYIWKNYATQILSILVILLPSIYIIGNLIIRGILDKELKDLREDYDETIIKINEGANEMQKEIEELKEENRLLKSNLKININQTN